MNDNAGAPADDPREADVETAQEVDPKSGYSDDPRVDPTPDGDGQGQANGQAPGGNGGGY